MLELRIIDLVSGQLVQSPRCGERRKDEAVERRVDARRHGHLDGLDTAARVVGKMLGNERLTERLNSAFLDHPLTGVPVKRFERSQLRPRAPLSQIDPLPENLRKLTFVYGHGFRPYGFKRFTALPLHEHSKLTERSRAFGLIALATCTLCIAIAMLTTGSERYDVV
jgi:hypothetical protein